MTVRPATLHDHAHEQSPFRSAVLNGLAKRQKAIPCKYFYDERGSRLFDRICTLAEYYPTRTEMTLIATYRWSMAKRIGPGCRLVDFGAGSSQKARLLLAVLDRPQAYLPVDICREHLTKSAIAIARDYPGLQVIALNADYTRRFRLPETSRAVGFFPGSTIGNLTPSNARRFLVLARHALDGGPMILGVDLKKPDAVLNAAYNDAGGVTAAFNLNLLVRINRELSANFDLGRFRHRAFYSRDLGRIEMHLESLAAQSVMVDGRSFAFAPGETIHTENSYKYSVDEVGSLANAAGYSVAEVWVDAAKLFAIFYLSA
jgi:dimethylhistidine N-methyltransferase